MISLPCNLAHVSAAAAKESARYALCSVNVHHDAERYNVEATNGHWALRVSGPVATEHPVPIPALDVAPNSATRALICPAAWCQVVKDAEKLTAKMVQPEQRSRFALVLGDDVATFGSSNRERTKVEEIRNVEGRFPNLADVMPKDDAERVTVGVDPKKLIDMLDAMTKMTSAECSGINLSLVMRNGEVALLEAAGINTDHQQEIKGVLMPLTR